MIEERETAGAIEEVIGRSSEVFVTAATKTMAVYEQVVRVTVTLSAPCVVTLPSVALAKGLMYSIRIIAGPGGTDTCTVQDLAGDAALTDITLTEDEDGVVLYSDGRNWWVMATNGLLATDYD